MKKIILLLSIMLLGLIVFGLTMEFDYYVQGNKVGTSTFTFDDENNIGKTSSEIQIQGQEIKTDSETKFDNDFIFETYQMNMVIDGVQRINMKSNYDKDKIKNSFNGINLPEIKTDSKVHIIDNGFIIEHIYALTKINNYFNKSFIPQLALSNQNTIYDFNAEKNKDKVTISYANVKMDVYIDGEQIKRIEIPAQGAKLINKKYDNEEANNVNYTEEQVSYNSNGLKIPGTLLKPLKKDKDIIFIFVHGSGANDRDETFREGNIILKPFKDLAENLANNGYSSFRYDKRSYLYMNQGIQKDIDPIDFIDDAKNAYNFIKEEYNFKNIYLIGHSQGASFVPLIVDNNFDKAIAIAPGTEEFIDQMIYQMDYQIKYFNNLDNPEQYKDTISQLKNIKKQANEIKNNIETGEYNPEDPILGANYDFLVKMSEITKKTINNFKNIEIPTLIINGTVDLKTPHEKLEEYEEELLKNKNIDIKYIKGMGHMLNIVGSLEQSQELTEIIVNWIEGD